MPAARGVKRSASKTASATSVSVPKNKKKRVAFQLEIPTAPKKRGSVFTCGQGDVGQLGLGEDVIETTKFKYVAGLGDKIVDVCAGGMHTIALDSDGKVWTFGCNDEGALGRPTAGDAEEGAAASVALPARAVAVSAGDSHSAALLQDGQVYAWGAFRDSHGSMGLIMRGREGKSCREPVRIDVGEPAAAVASGGDHLVILSTSGGVYTMGCGEQGQLGRLSQRSASRDARQGFSALLVPGRVTLKWAARRVWAGYHATLALDGAGRVFGWGLNNYGQLGITGEKRKTALYSPTECDAFDAAGDWRAVACGQHHSLALDGRGRVFAVGRCEYGRLGLGDREGDAEALEPVPALSDRKCVSIATGTCNSFAVTDTGAVLAWGMGSEGQLGTGAAADAAAPAPAVVAGLAARRPAKAACGAQHTALLAIDTTEVKEKSPSPEMETEEQPAQETEKEQKEEKPKRGNKRQKKGEQEDEVSSTSSAQLSEVAEESKPQKINGDEKKESPMEVDETDNTKEKKDDTQPEPTKTETEPPKETETESEKPHPEAESKPAPSEPSQDIADVTDPPTTEDTKEDTQKMDTDKQDTETKTPDVEMKEEAKTEVNGAPEVTPVETKKVEESIANDTAVVTSA